MAAFQPLASSSSSPPKEGRGGGLGAPALLDEFTAPAEKSGCLERSRGCIERLFRVRLAILGALSGGWFPPRGCPGPATTPTTTPQGAAGAPADGRRIWLSLWGEKEAVRGAKEYIKGLCEPELEEKEYYPKDMHCIFVGAQNLFLNCLIQGTSADITVAEIGTINIKGGAESVVMARSHIQQFVSLFKNNTILSNGRESEVKKQFKQLVEAYADKYTMDLLILPSSLKRELLSLAQNEGCRAEDKIINVSSTEETPAPLSNKVQKKSGINSDYKTGEEEARNKAGTPVSELARKMDTVFHNAPEGHFLPINGLNSLETSTSKERHSCKRRSSDAEERLPKKQFSFEIGQEGRHGERSTPPGQDIEVIDLVSDECTESDGPGACAKESEEISEETEYKILVNFFKSMGYSQQIVEKVIGDYGPLVEPLVLLEEIEKESKKGSIEEAEVADIPQTQVEKEERNYNNQVHKKESSRNKKADKISVPQSQYRAEVKTHVSNHENQIVLSGSKNLPHRDHSRACSSCSEDSPVSQTSGAESNGLLDAHGHIQRVTKDGKQKGPSLLARGASETPRPPVDKETGVPHPWAEQSASTHNQHGHSTALQLRTRDLSSQKLPNHLPDSGPPLQLATPYPDRRAVVSQDHRADPSVTGVQRFQESLKIPYKLELKNEPGRAGLKYIIIDGSNVAISHGLQKFFSCRGIAIAVDYFWKRGHRKITVFVPQWRTRRDVNITEQYFLTQLQDVGILALTPARVVCGARIASHDDRFLLHLAEKTGGVIVTNDNLREFVGESTSWREIIQRRLLPYTFVGDIFMVPDDPMGRNGPGLEQFLQEEDTRFRGISSQHNLGSLWGTSHFLMQPEGHGPSPKSPLPGLIPILPTFPPAPQAKSSVPPHPRSATETMHLKEALGKIFPTSEQREKIEEILAHHPHMRDMNALSALVLDLG
uniref:NEDD4-binding protein 1 n=1 Tax=Pogona vitticeps TaxID=103695 RepID=A0A6J0TAC7_9SAUR